MATLPKWTDERTDTLTNFVGDETPVSQASVAEAAEQLETTTRSVSSSASLKSLLSQLLSQTTAASTHTQRSHLTLKTGRLVLSLSKVRFCLWNLLTTLSQLPKWRL